MIKYEIMAAVIQESIDKTFCEIKKPWEEKGVNFKGTKVKGLPKELEYTVEGLKLTRELVQPEYVIVNEEIKPNELSLTLKAKDFEGVKVRMDFYPTRWQNGYGLNLSLNFELEPDKFKSIAKGALKYNQYPVCLSVDSAHAYSELMGYIRDLKNDLLVASRLRKKS